MMHRKRKTSVEKVQVDNFQIFKHVESSDRAYKIVWMKEKQTKTTIKAQSKRPFSVLFIGKIIEKPGASTKDEIFIWKLFSHYTQLAQMSNGKTIEKKFISHLQSII